jgi:hypothetical protein
MAAVLAVTGCATARGAALPPPAPTFGIVMREYRFDHAAQAPSGRVIFRAHNAGAIPHELTLVHLPADYPATIDEQLHAPTRRSVDTVAILFNRLPGEDGVFAADLAPGRYGFICFLKDPDGVAYAFKGMSSVFAVT